jgi:hypothetical protein
VFIWFKKVNIEVSKNENGFVALVGENVPHPVFKKLY